MKGRVPCCAVLWCAVCSVLAFGDLRFCTKMTDFVISHEKKALFLVPGSSSQSCVMCTQTRPRHCSARCFHRARSLRGLFGLCERNCCPSHSPIRTCASPASKHHLCDVVQSRMSNVAAACTCLNHKLARDESSGNMS